MSLFQPIELVWKGEVYKVKANEVMKLIAIIESHITFNALYSGSPPLSSIAFAYAAALRYAGADVEDDEVYCSLFGGDGIGIQSTIQNLSLMMIPPSAVMERMDKPTKKPQQAKKPKG